MMDPFNELKLYTYMVLGLALVKLCTTTLWSACQYERKPPHDQVHSEFRL